MTEVKYTLARDCGHVFFSYNNDDNGYWIYADYVGCIDGVWYETCSSENCYGLCEDRGLCGCEGWDSSMCCVKETNDNS